MQRWILVVNILCGVFEIAQAEMAVDVVKVVRDAQTRQTLHPLVVCYKYLVQV